MVIRIWLAVRKPFRPRGIATIVANYLVYSGQVNHYYLHFIYNPSLLSSVHVWPNLKSSSVGDYLYRQHVVSI